MVIDAIKGFGRDYRHSGKGRALGGAALLILAGGAGWWFLHDGEEASAAPSTSAPVRVEAVQRGPLRIELKALGTITPLASVSVRSRVDGELLRLNFQEGQTVTKGQSLAEIDPRPYRAALTQVQGERQQNVAQLDQARRELQQHQALAREGFTSQTVINQQQALVGRFTGAVASSDGRIADARLQLEYASIRAPISGRIGIRGVDAGNMVRSGDTTEIATITQMQPISVIFTIPETQIDDVRQAMKAGSLKVDAWDRGERKLLATGQLTTVDNRIDSGSGTLRLRGQFANGDERLFPNQFVNVRLGLRTIADAVSIPGAAVQQGVKGPFAYIVDRDGKARRRDIVPGASNGERTEILRGVAAGEQVVLEGFDRVRDGEKVEIIGRTPPASLNRKTARTQ